MVGDGGLATIWSVPGWEPLQSFRVSEQHAMRCRYSHDGKSLATLGLNWIKIWDGATGEYRFLIRGAGSDLAFTPDDGRIAASGDAGTVRFWDAKQEQGAFVHNARDESLRRFVQPRRPANHRRLGEASSMPSPAPSCGRSPLPTARQ